MKIRVVSDGGDGLGLVWRLQQEGHDVTVYIKDPHMQECYEGMCKHVEEIEDGLDEDTLIVFDMVGFGRIADRLRDDGYKVIGGSKFADDLELKREFGAEIVDQAGIATPEWDLYSNFDEAIKEVKKTGKAYVFKPDKNKGGCGMTYVAEDADDMLAMLAFFKANWKGEVSFVMQEKLKGTEVSTELWYCDGEPIMATLNSTTEQKRLMDHDIGPNTGCMTSLCWFWKDPEQRRIFQETHKKVLAVLKEARFTGPLDMNCLLVDGKPNFLEWTPRMGYSAIYAMIEVLDMPLGEFLNDLAEGRDPVVYPSYDFAAAIRVCVLPYPMDKTMQPLPVRGIEDGEQHIIPLNVKMVGKDMVMAGNEGIVCECTGHDADLDQLERQVYDRVDQVKVPDKFYRTDCISGVRQRVQELLKYEGLA